MIAKVEHVIVTPLDSVRFSSTLMPIETPDGVWHQHYVPVVSVNGRDFQVEQWSACGTARDLATLESVVLTVT